MAMSVADPMQQRTQLQEQRRKVDFDSYDITVDDLVRRLRNRRIEIAPAYQRQFRWDVERQSRLIESIMLGIPVPPLFMATNVDADEGRKWEVVDGLQRLLSLANFVGDAETRSVARLEGGPLELKGLEILTSLEGATVDELPTDLHDGLLDRPIRVIVLNDKSDVKVRYDLFERLNTGGVRLTDHEVRESVFMGEFVNLLSELAGDKSYNRVLALPSSRTKDGTPQDYVLRFFAFLERYKRFEHSVRDFLNDFIAAAAKDPQLQRRRGIFHETFDFLADVFPEGLRTRKGSTPVNLFEGISVGAALALRENPALRPPSDLAWVYSDEMKRHTTGATNNRSRVTARIEFSRDRFLAGK